MSENAVPAAFSKHRAAPVLGRCRGRCYSLGTDQTPFPQGLSPLGLPMREPGLNLWALSLCDRLLRARELYSATARASESDCIMLWY